MARRGGGGCWHGRLATGHPQLNLAGDVQLRHMERLVQLGELLDKV